jgi:hypothetical protein
MPDNTYSQKDMLKKELEQRILESDHTRLLSQFPQEKRDEIISNVSSTLESYNLPAKRTEDLVWLYSFMPKHAGEIIDLSRQVEKVAEEQGIEFKDVLLHTLEDSGIPVAYAKNAPDFRYLIDAIQIIGGYKCAKKSAKAIKNALETGSLLSNIATSDEVTSCGIRKIREQLKKDIDVSAEVGSQILYTSHPMPMNGYTNLMDLTEMST